MGAAPRVACGPVRALLLACAVARARAVRLLSLGRGRSSIGAVPAEYKLRLENFQNVQYFGEFTAGGQTLPVVYDTGSFEVILLSTLCTHCEHGAAIYDAQKSSTFQKGEDIVAQHVFGSGPVTSRKGLETCLVGPGSSSLAAPSMPFWQVMDHSIDVWDKHSKFSGIVGLGHTPSAPKYDSGEVKHTDASLLERVGVTAFSVCLERAGGTPPGWLTMGSNVEAAQTSSVYKHVPIVGEVHWGVQMTGLSGGAMQKHPGWDWCQPSCAAIIDSGTSLITAPGGALEELYPILSGINKDCSNLGELPDICFNLGSERFCLPPAIYVIQLTHWEEKPRGVWDIFSPPELVPVTECVPAFMQMDKRTKKYGPVWILGMPFLRYYNVVFQRSPKSVHIAYADYKCDPSATKPSIFSSATDVNGTSNGPPSLAASPGRNGTAPVRQNVAAVSLPKSAEPGDNTAIRVPPWMLGKEDLEF